MTRLGPLLAAAGAAVLALTACGPDDNPGPNYSSVSPTASASTSASPSPTSSPSPTVPTTGPNVSPGEVPPTEPAAATAQDSGGALSFIAYYVKMSDWVFATADPKILDPFFAPDCRTCQSRQSFLTDLVADGQHLEGGRITIKQLAVVSNDGRQGADFAVTSVTDVGAANVVASDGQVTQSFPASTGFQLTDWVKFSDGKWQIVEERRV